MSYSVVAEEGSEQGVECEQHRSALPPPAYPDLIDGGQLDPDGHIIAIQILMYVFADWAPHTLLCGELSILFFRVLLYGHAAAFVSLLKLLAYVTEGCMIT